MHTASYEFLMKPKESAGCHQTLSARVGSGDKTTMVVVAAGLVSPEWAIFSFPAQLGFVRKCFVHLVSGLILVL